MPAGLSVVKAMAHPLPTPEAAPVLKANLGTSHWCLEERWQAAEGNGETLGADVNGMDDSDLER